MPRAHFILCLAVVAASAWIPARAQQASARKGSYVDVRTYLPDDYVTDGSVDYKVHIQKCFDEHLNVYFPGSDDPDQRGFEKDNQRSTQMLLFGVGAQSGNRQTWGQWDEPIAQHAKPYYLRAHFDMSFKEQADPAPPAPATK